jgi:hypothetical protein
MTRSYCKWHQVILLGFYSEYPVYLRLLVLLLTGTFTGCAALTNPVKNGLQPEWLPEELLAKPKEIEYPLPLELLGQAPQPVYRLAPNDTLGVWIEGVLSSPTQGPPVYQFQGTLREGPVLGYPVPVRDDGTIDLPLVPPINVQGMTLAETKEAIRKAYTVTTPLIQQGRERIIVNLLRRRHYHVVVLRDELLNFNSPGSETTSILITATQKRGNGHALDLPAGENDVLNALGRSGGTPGLDAYNEVIVEHRSRAMRIPPPGGQLAGTQVIRPQIVRIPLRLAPGEMPAFGPNDVLLDDGDVVYVPQRDVERFYTGGLLPPGEYILPSNYDLDVLEAIAYVRGPLVNGGFGVIGGTASGYAWGSAPGNSAGSLSGRVTPRAFGAPSPTLLTVLRNTPDGGRVCIVVDLKRALCDPSHRLLVKAGDILILQETPCQAITRFFADAYDRFFFLFTWTSTSSSGSALIQSQTTPSGTP